MEVIKGQCGIWEVVQEFLPSLEVGLMLVQVVRRLTVVVQ